MEMKEGEVDESRALRYNETLSRHRTAAGDAQLYGRLFSERRLESQARAT